MSEHEHQHKLAKITINHKHFESPTPTRCEALYTLAGLGADQTLYEEMEGHEDDRPIPHDGTEIHLHEGEKFYSEAGKPRLEVEIVIDNKHIDSPRETTGAALYILGQVLAGYTLYREVEGPEEDPPIANDATVVRVRKHEKFYSSIGQITPGALQ